MVLHPRGRSVWRLIVIPRNRLPEVGSHEREWAFVDTVGRSPEKVEDALDRQQYETKTRGERVRPEARRAGEGVYVLARHGDHTHLAYDVLTKKSGSPEDTELERNSLQGPRIEDLRDLFVIESGARLRSRTLFVLTACEYRSCLTRQRV